MGSQQNNIRISPDYGNSWPTAFSNSRNMQGVAISSTGKYMAAVAYGFEIWLSSDYGANWSPATGAGNRNWVQIAMSADGAKMIASVYTSDTLYISTDYGVHWRPTGSVATWYGLCCSANFTRIIATQTAGSVYVSYDSGLTFQSANFPVSGGNYLAVTCTPDFDVLAVGDQGGQIYVSGPSGLRTSAPTKVRERERGMAARESATVLNEGCRGGSEGRQVASEGDRAPWFVWG